MTLALNNSQINEALEPYGVVTTSDHLAAGIKIYIELLLKWNRSVSLTTVTKPEEILRFHFGESLFALGMLPVEKSRLADVGSGAGFPGLPLAMARPSHDVTLIEPNAKKFAFLNEVIRQLGIANVITVRARTAELQSSSERFDIITARAVGQFDELVGWAKDNLSPAGRLMLWLGEEDAKQISRDARFEWATRLRIPLTDRRLILIGSSKGFISR